VASGHDDFLKGCAWSASVKDRKWKKKKTQKKNDIFDNMMMPSRAGAEISKIVNDVRTVGQVGGMIG